MKSEIGPEPGNLHPPQQATNTSFLFWIGMMGRTSTTSFYQSIPPKIVGLLPVNCGQKQFDLETKADQKGDRQTADVFIPSHVSFLFVTTATLHAERGEELGSIPYIQFFVISLERGTYLP